MSEIIYFSRRKQTKQTQKNRKEQNVWYTCTLRYRYRCMITYVSTIHKRIVKKTKQIN